MNYLDVHNSVYRTSPENLTLLSRIFPTLCFYYRFIKIVFRASAKAKNGAYSDSEWGADSFRIMRQLEKIGIQFTISGLENLENLEGPCVLVGNHMSIMETLIMPIIVLTYKRVTFVVKESLLNYPVFKYIMRARNPIAVTRTNPRQDLKTVLSDGLDRLNKGISIVVFPQTTRSVDFDPETFGSIGIKLAKKAGVPVVPFALKTDAWENGSYSKDFGKINPQIPVNIAFGVPLLIEGKGTEEHQQIIEFIRNKLKGWQQ